jgi:hypothetical protein
VTIPVRSPLAALARFALFAAWVLAGLFFAIVGLRTTRDFSPAPNGAVLTAPITTARAALITAAYSLGGAAVALGLTTLALPRADRPWIRRLAVLWVVVTAGLILSRRAAGWPLFLAALVALAIAADASRRLGRAGWRAWQGQPGCD